MPVQKKKRKRLPHPVRIDPLTRILVSDSPARNTEAIVVSGTQSQIEAAASRMARRTRGCVTIAVIVGQYHLRTCEQFPRGGFDPEGN